MAAALELFWQNLEGFMAWNLFLAMIPCVLSFMLFAKRSPRRLPSNPLWWLGLTIFILFLPNAPYVITDIIHFVRDMRSDVSDNWLIFVLIPQYIVFILLGFQCYVISLIKLVQYVDWLKLTTKITLLEISINFICAIGVYWGRVHRLNSWDIFTNPQSVLQDAIRSLRNPNFFLGIIIFFIVFTSLYYIFKWINIAIFFHWQNRSNRVPV